MALFAKLLIASLLLTSLVGASPLPDQQFHGSDSALVSPLPGADVFLCHLPFIKGILCRRKAPSGPFVITPLGIAHGSPCFNAANRFAVRYASAQRWQHSVAANTWKLPCVYHLVCGQKSCHKLIFILVTARLMSPHFPWRALRVVWMRPSTPRTVCLCFSLYRDHSTNRSMFRSL